MYPFLAGRSVNLIEAGEGRSRDRGRLVISYGRVILRLYPQQGDILLYWKRVLVSS